MEIDRSYAIEFLSAGICHVHCRRLHTGVVIGRIQAAEGLHGLCDHRCHLSLICNIAADGNRLVVGKDEFVCYRTNRILVDICQRYRGSGLREGLCRR
jgi:hypothetical protein